MAILIKNGRIVNPATNMDMRGDILIEKDRVKQVAPYIEAQAEQVIEAYGCIVMPGFIDLHVHLREPGFEYKETIETGTRAAARGGFTTICAMPNTNPVIDTPGQVQFVLDKAKEAGNVHVIPVGAVTYGQQGEQITDIAGMKRQGAGAISEDGKSVMNTYVYREAMKTAAREDVPVFAHCEDKSLAGNGCINQGKKSQEYQVQGISNGVEDVIVARDILLAKETGARLHLCHCSTKDSVAFTKMAKEAGIKVTAEVCPHHFVLSEDDIVNADSNYKMNPPLRSKEDVEALKLGLKSGVVDAISTDHAPHHEDEKKQHISTAPFGIVGLETAAALTYTELVCKGWLTPMQMAEKMSYNPAKILKLDKGDISEGKIADITIINPAWEYTIDANEFASKGKNTPFHGRKVKGRVVYTIVDGKIVFDKLKENKEI